MGFLRSLLSVFVVLQIARQGAARHIVKRIVGGEMLVRGEAKFLVSLWFMKPIDFTENTGLYHVCGGALIHPQWVLTSAYCFDDLVWPGLEVWGDWEVRLGEYQLNLTEPGEQVFSIERVAKPDEHDITIPTDDVALIKLNGSAVLDQYTGTIAVDTDVTHCAEVDATCTVYGWGQLKEEPSGYGSVLPYKASVTVWSNTACATAFNGTGTHISYMELCASGPGRDACAGDAGSPLVCKCKDTTVVSGMVFHGIGCARAQYPGIYERVEEFHSFIDKTINGNQKKDDDKVAN